jgi:hypothetical protein
MCLLTFLAPGIPPDLAALFNGAYYNDDGHGFAIATHNRLIVQHGMRAEPTIEAFDTLRRQHPDTPALFHSRLGTHGKATIDNCHPFPIGRDRRTVLAHNGILPPPVQPAKGDPRSDTRIAAEEFIPAQGPLRSRRIRMRFERWMTRRNKAVILTVDRRHKQQAYILNERSGVWDGGIWYSNDGYLPPPPTRWTAPGDAAWERPPWDRRHGITDWCGCCQAIIDVTDNDCPYCGWCLDCEQAPEDCLCHTPAVSGRQIGTAGTT